MGMPALSLQATCSQPVAQHKIPNSGTTGTIYTLRTLDHFPSMNMNGEIPPASLSESQGCLQGPQEYNRQDQICQGIHSNHRLQGQDSAFQKVQAAGAISRDQPG